MASSSMRNNRSASLGVYRGHGWQTKQKAKEVAGLVCTIAKGRGLSHEQISEQAGISKTCLESLLQQYKLTDCTLGRIRLWAKKIAEKKL